MNMCICIKKVIADVLMLSMTSTAFTAYAGTSRQDLLRQKTGIDNGGGKSYSSSSIDRAAQENIANSMSTTDMALAMDFDWLIDKAYNVSKGEWPNAIDDSLWIA